MKTARLGLEESTVRGDASVSRYVQEVWARRAARLAQIPSQEAEGERISLVLLRLGAEIYGLEAQYVFDIRPVGHVTPVPRTPKWVAGVVNLRGRIMSVLDLQSFFGLTDLHAASTTEAERGDVHPQYLIVVEVAGMEIALLTDIVLTVYAVPVSQMQPVTDMMILNIPPDYVRGMIAYDEHVAVGRPAEAEQRTMLVVVDLPTLLADKRLIVDEDLTVP